MVLGKKKIIIFSVIVVIALVLAFVLLRIRKNKMELSDIADKQTKTTNKVKRVFEESGKYPLKKGSSGVYVKYLQEALNKLYGANLDTDGKFGNKTAEAVKHYLNTDTVDSKTATQLTLKYQTSK